MEQPQEATVILQLSKTKDGALGINFKRDEETNDLKCNKVIALIKSEFHDIPKAK